MIFETLSRLESSHVAQKQKLDSLEDKIDHHLQVVADNTTSMSNSLANIQETNSRLIEVIANRSCVSPVVTVLIIGVLAAVFLIRELSIHGGRARIGFDGVDIASGK